MNAIAQLRAVLDQYHFIEKAKKYLKKDAKGPAGAKIHTGPKGGRYYLTEELKAIRDKKKGKGPEKKKPADTKPEPEKEKPVKKKSETKPAEPKKRLPAFRKNDDGSVYHRTKSGEHGPGMYTITERAGKHYLSFTGKDGKTVKLSTSKDIRKLKEKVQTFKAAPSPVVDRAAENLAAARARKTKVKPSGTGTGAGKTGKRVMAKPMQVRKIKESLVRAGLEPDKIDVESLVDPTISYRENLVNIKSQLQYTDKSGESVKSADARVNHEICLYIQEDCEVRGDKGACDAYHEHGCHKVLGPIAKAKVSYLREYLDIICKAKTINC